MLPTLVEKRGALPVRRGRYQSVGRRDVPAWDHAPRAIPSRRTSPSSRAATTTARSASSRTRAGTNGCARRPTSWRTSARRSIPAGGRSSCSARSSTTTRRRTIPSCDFAELLAAVNDVPGVERIRFASPHPRHTGRRLIEAVRDLPKVCKHLHLPVQSGSTPCLQAMRRRYTRESYLDLVAQIRETIPGVALSTDMIVGFPGEDSGRLRADAVADRGRAVSQHVLVQVFAAAEHAGVEAAAGRRERGGEDGADRRAAVAAA